MFSGPSQHAHLLRKPAVPLHKESPGTRPQGSGTWAEIAVMKVEGVHDVRIYKVINSSNLRMTGVNCILAPASPERKLT